MNEFTLLELCQLSVFFDNLSYEIKQHVDEPRFTIYVNSMFYQTLSKAGAVFRGLFYEKYTNIFDNDL